jgi:multiple sugar transport system permease protein
VTRRQLLGQVARHLALAVGGVFMLGPVVLMLRASVTPGAVAAPGDLLAGGVTFEHVRMALEQVPLGRYYVNSTVVCVVTFALQVLVCVPAAYALARLRFGLRRLTVGATVVLMFVPFQVLAIPVYLMLRAAGLVDSLAALVLPFVGSAFGVFLLRQFFLSIPATVFDAARIDGAGTVSVLVRVVLPTARPALVSFGIFSVTSLWNSYFWPSFVLTDDSAATVPFGVVAFLNTDAGTEYGPQMAVAALSVLPLLLGFLIAQRQFVRGIALTGQPD